MDASALSIDDGNTVRNQHVVVKNIRIYHVAEHKCLQGDYILMTTPVIRELAQQRLHVSSK